MPTSRPRHQVTETDAVARALDAAAKRWPGESRSQLLVRLIVVNGESAAELNAAEASRRKVVIDSLAGSFTGLFAPDYLQKLRAEWPE